MRGIATRLGTCLLLVVLAIPVAVSTPTRTEAAPDLRFFPSRWNGRKIYLSPARHLQPPRARGECGPKSEDRLAFNTAWYATLSRYFNDRFAPSSPYRNLLTRGYRVRIGRGTVSSAIRNSNAWGSTRHIAIHSNAVANPNCADTDASRFGTWGIHRYDSPRGRDLTNKLTHTIGINSRRGPLRSPGTNDKVCTNPPGAPVGDSSCTTIDLGELRETRMPAAYMEDEFHTWQRGYNWLDRSNQWAWRFGWGVDWHLGWPRRR